MKSHLQQSNILVADDHPVNLILMQFLLEQQGAKVYTATDGNEVLQVAAENPQLDLMLLDVQMPYRDGKECASFFKSEPAYRHIKLFAISAETGELEKQQCLDAGFDGYLEKPLDIDKLHEAISLLKGEPFVAAKLPAEIFMKPLLLDYLGMVTMNDKDAALEILQETATTAPGLISEIGTALANGQYDKAATVLHKLKSLVAILEFEPLLEYVKTSETQLKALQYQQVTANFEQQQWLRLLNYNIVEATAVIEKW